MAAVKEGLNFAKRTGLKSEVLCVETRWRININREHIYAKYTDVPVTENS